MSSELLPGGTARVPARGEHLPVPTSAVPLHQPRTFDHVKVASREECWERLGAAVREKVNSRLGPLVEWWALDAGGRVRAVLLGTDALVTVQPTIRGSGAPAYQVSSLRLDARSFRRVRLSGSTTPAQPSPPSVTPAAGGLLAARMDDRMRGFLGLLPTRAQHLLQEPFVTSSPDLRYDWTYNLSEPAHGIGGGTIRTWCYLSDSRVVTFASGVGYGFRPGAGAGTWDISCWHVRTSVPSSGG